MGRAELPFRAKENLRTGNEDSPQEGEEVQLHQGLQGAAQGDLRPVREEDHPTCLREAGKIGLSLRAGGNMQGEDKQYCHKVEKVELEEVCDMKFDSRYL